jgi:NAD(P)-dependent dehydrogenase (short-subunit alcohol dehydrogenase family)
VKTVLLDINQEKADEALERVRTAGGEGLALKTSVLSREELEQAAKKILSTFGRVDILINGAGGNSPKASTGPDQSFFDLPEDGARFVFDLNFMGTFLASQVFGKIMAKQKEGVILNIASMNATPYLGLLCRQSSTRPLSKTNQSRNRETTVTSDVEIKES